MDGSIKTHVRSFIGEAFLFGEGAEALADNSSFLDAGLIDSTGILELICFVEKTYGFTVADEEVVPANFDSLNGITAYIGRKLNGAAPKAGVCHAR